MSFPRVASLATANDFRERLAALGISLPFDEMLESGPSSPLGRAYRREGGTIGNRFCILPMEGWDGTDDGRPTDLTRPHWENFGTRAAPSG